MTKTTDPALALHGGPKVKTEPFSTGKRFGLEEAKHLLEALEQNTLFYHSGEKVKTFLEEFNRLYGVQYSVATSSGTAAIHVALLACGVSVGDEVITSPITDMGTIVGILYQNAVPVFADLDPHTYTMDPKSVRERITPRTKAILAVHLAGNPCSMDEIMAIAREHNVKVVEDCAQSYLSYYKGRLVGTIGDYGCFSTNDFKHISTGDGGIVTVNSGEEDDYHCVHAFADKNYRRFGDSVNRDVEMLAPNYRMTELQGAVGIAQLKKLPWICKTRQVYGDRITEGISGLTGVFPHKVTEGGTCSYWFYMFRVMCDRDRFSDALNAEGIPSSAGYIPQVVYRYSLFQNRQAYERSRFPFDLSNVRYDSNLCPNAEAILQTAIRIPVSEFYSERDIDDIILAIRKVANHLTA